VAPAFMQRTAVSSFTDPVTMRKGTVGARSRARESAAIPSNLGRVKSERITSGRKASSSSRNDSRVATRRATKGMRARSSSYSTSSASMGTSSSRSMRRGAAPAPSASEPA